MPGKLPVYIILLPLLLFFNKAQSQPLRSDILHSSLKYAANDTIKMFALDDLASYYAESNRDSAMFYIEKAIVIAQELKQPLQVAEFLLFKAYLFQKQSNFSLSFKLCNEALAIIEDRRNEKNAYIPGDDEFAADPEKYRIRKTISVFHQLGNTYSMAGNKEKAIEYFQNEIQVSEELKTKQGLITSNMNIGSIYSQLGKYDSAFIYANRALENANLMNQRSYLGFILEDIGDVYFKRSVLDSAKYYYRQAILVNKEQNNLAGEIGSNNAMARFYQKTNQPDSMLLYASAALQLGNRLQSASTISISSGLIATAWKMLGFADSALAYLTLSKTLSDSINKELINKTTQFQHSNFEEQLKLEKQAQESISYRNKIRTIALIGGLGLLALLAFVFYRNNLQKQKANTVLETTLNNLKSTQTQLIHAEKMASLGELTAGIAHEIQNPLNFVNNFSEVNEELLAEMKDELDKGNIDDAKAIANDAIENQQKILHHGKRADAIVKGMLQHSRSSSSQKEPTDINVLADEYLRLAYHGLRAKDKSFNATMKTDFDKSIGNINIIPQDIGRVILNLITNAFYVVQEKKKSSQATAEQDKYEPTVSVSTKKINGRAEISVEDNGNGISPKVLDKIFQPFFTTKPTGQGTGLGLSLSYDIVKAHGGELKVENKEGEGAKFIIILSI